MPFIFHCSSLNCQVSRMRSAGVSRFKKSWSAFSASAQVRLKVVLMFRRGFTALILALDSWCDALSVCEKRFPRTRESHTILRSPEDHQ